MFVKAMVGCDEGVCEVEAVSAELPVNLMPILSRLPRVARVGY